jgi:uncharacterized membrane protein
MSKGSAPEIQESATVIIRRAPSDVWDFVSHLATTPTWRTTVTSIEPPDTLQVGEQFSATTRLLGRTWRWVLELTELDDGRQLDYVVVQGVVKPYVSYRVEPDPDGTRFTMTGGINQFGLGGRLLTRFAHPALRRETAAHLTNLKSLLESRSHPAP